MTSEMTVIEMLKETGLQVWMRKLTDEYCYCTDGINICYVQWSDLRTTVSTVHIPNRQTGTGFQYSDTITPDHVRKAMMTIAPGWASSKDRASVKKYKDWNDFHNSNSFNAQLFQV
jgi:hypothetical protein